MGAVYTSTISALTISTSAKSVLSVICGSTIAARVKDVSLFFNGSASGNNALVELVLFTTDGTGTAGTAQKLNADSQARAATATTKNNYTVEPTTATILESWYVPLSSGFAEMYPLGVELFIPPSRLLTIRITSPVAVTSGVAATLQWEEG